MSTDAVTLYRAGPPDASTFGTMSSWTTNRAHAEAYTTEAYGPHFGGQVVYAATVARPAVLDLRSDPRAGLAEVGLDLDDYPHLGMHVLVREIAAVIRAEYEWVAFVDFDMATYGFADSDEWLYLGSAPVTVELAV